MTIVSAFLANYGLAFGTEEIKGLSAKEVALLNGPSHRVPTYSEVRQLDLADKPALLDRFSKANLTNKTRLAWAIAHLGGDNALDALKAPLEEKRYGRELTLQDEQAMLEIVRAIGYLAQRSDAAYEYLASSLSTNVWRERIDWRPKEPIMAHPEIRYVGMAIMSLGLSGDKRAMTDIANAIKANESIQDRIAGDVVDAVFHLWYINEHGKEEIARGFMGEVGMQQEFEAFYRTETGRTWKAWYEKAKRKKEPPKQK